ncbi:MAG: DinB family protein [Acidobacteriaceae bacterium]|nr:DinB family protein [Acidobacteriaceae bacterium]
MATEDRALRDHLLELLRGGSAHVDIATVVDNFPHEFAGTKPKNVPYTPWQLLEHIRFTVNDLLLFSTDPKYAAPNWPDDYWPAKQAAPEPGEWERSVKALKADLSAFEGIIQDSKSNLYARIPWGDGQTLLREVLLASDHTSYHLGELVLIRREFGVWKN